ncbi:GIY-YIG nuclease family protein [Prochlorococcus sp. MIT 1307]|uniref:GIY-YIG nuclease family protein n=1 Tax=Prochlorococcus sp. MIT 1307 TaxID=3096219 RepID=UPI002A754641|nr:GIY-YIG nuclease family protein [Prochlorococcus sp. MIT 1307]
MEASKKQGDLFPSNSAPNTLSSPHKELRLSKEVLKSWQARIHNYQSQLFQGLNSHHQGSLFTKFEKAPIDDFEPLKLTPVPLSFWRWPKCSLQGPAIYLVMDRLADFESQILLYIGETVAADKRWKGEHDCKSYLAAYSEALSFAGIQNQISIRFWSDVPENTRSRRKIEQELIQRWLPPFNKETRAHWGTPFTAETS